MPGHIKKLRNSIPDHQAARETWLQRIKAIYTDRTYANKDVPTPRPSGRLLARTRFA
jgi:hypothetical protein